MQTRVQKAIAIVAAMTLAACGAEQVTTTVPELSTPNFDVTASPVIRVSEFHYDNNGTDQGERVEVSFPTGTSLTGYRIVRYNGSTPSAAAIYSSPAISGNASELLSSATVTECGNGRSVAVLAYPTDGLQNGANDGFALVNGTTVIELLSYEGSFTVSSSATIGAGQVSVDVGVSQSGNLTLDPLGASIQRQADGTWLRTSTNSFGSCNDGTGGAAVGPLATITVSPGSATVAFNGTSQLSATGKDANGLTVASATFTWSSSNTAVATVSTTGLVAAVAPGNAVITATSGEISGAANITVSEPATLPSVRFTEIHYDNSSEDFGEAIEIEGPEGTDLTGWKVVLYNGSGGIVYDTRTLTGVLGATCTGRGVRVLEYTTSFLQNGPDGMALVDAAGEVVEFLSYEGVFIATDGPAAGKTSRNIGVAQSGAALNTSLQRSLSDTWSSATDNFGLCNGIGTRTPRTTLSFGFRTPFDEALPVGFEDLLTVTERLDGTVVGFSTPLVSETPDIAEVLPDNVIRGKAAGVARFRATATNGFSLTYDLPIKVATAGNASYASHTDFGTPFDNSPADDYLLAREQSTVSYSNTRNTPNWVAYNLESSHMVSGQDRCDCFTFDPALPASFARYSTFDYVGSGYSRGHLVKSADRTSGSLDNARTFYFTNIVPQTSANNGGPWLQLENYLSNKARDENKEIFIVAGVAGSLGTINNKGLITIPASLWKVAIVLPRNRGLADVNNGLVPDEVIAVVMPNVGSMPSADWKYYATTVDAVEALSGYNVFDKLNDQIEIALESNTKPPVARVNGPFEIMAGEAVTLNASASSDPDNDALTFAWSYGDSRTGTGANTTVKYDVPGTYTAIVTVTDIRDLFDRDSTTVKVLSSAEGLTKAAAQVQALGEQNRLNRGLANSLAVKIRNAAASITRDNRNAAEGQIGALINELQARVQAGDVASADAEAAILTLQRVLASLSFGL